MLCYVMLCYVMLCYVILNYSLVQKWIASKDLNSNYNNFWGKHRGKYWEKDPIY